MNRVDDIYMDLELLIAEHKSYQKVVDENIRLKSVLKDIKVEIDHDLKNAPYWYDEEHLDELGGFQDGLDRAIEIINKHIEKGINE